MSRYLSLCLLSLAAALPASAQQSPPAGPPPRPDMARMIEREGDDMALLLGLSTAQRAGLDAFLKAFGPPHCDRPEGPPPASATFADHLAAMEKESASRAADEHERLAAARAFYTSLDTRQRQLFEALQRLRHGPGGPGGPGPRPGDMRGGPGAPPPAGEGPPPR